jgi:hypothetical protein
MGTFKLSRKGENMGGKEQKDTKLENFYSRGSIYALFVFGILVTVVLVVVAYSINPNLGFPVMLVFGVVDVVIFLTLASHILNYLGLSCESEALGLPKGSIRAVIAIGLIVIFAIMSIFMQMQLSQAPLIGPDGNIVTYNGTVVLDNYPSQDKKDFALQTLTTISTLVVAVAGFYFGQQAVTAAKTQPQKNAELTIVEPGDFVKIKSDGEAKISLETNPENLAIDWQVIGDARTSVRLEKPGEFVYKPSAKPQRTEDVVTLIFNVVNDPKAKEKLVVLIEG